MEDWLWINLENLCQLKPLVRQYFVRGQYCDVLAIVAEGQLCILELKNVEDRYVVQQIIRYYNALLTGKRSGWMLLNLFIQILIAHGIQNPAVVINPSGQG